MDFHLIQITCKLLVAWETAQIRCYLLVHGIFIFYRFESPDAALCEKELAEQVEGMAFIKVDLILQLGIRVLTVVDEFGRTLHE